MYGVFVQKVLYLLVEAAIHNYPAAFPINTNYTRVSV